MAAVMRRALIALLGLAAFVVACDTGFGPDRASVQLLIQPRFAQQETGGLDGEDPALRLNNVRVVMVDEAGDTVVNSVVDWPADQDTLRLEVAVEVSGEQTFQFQLQGREDDMVLFHSPILALELSSDASAPQVVEPVLEYAGPEASLVAVTVSAPVEVLLAGDRRRLTAVGWTDQETQVVDPLMVWSSLDTLAATVDTFGAVHVKHDAGRTVQIVGRVAFRSLVDTVSLPVAPAALVISQSPDTIQAIGWPQTLWATPLGVDGDTVRNVEVDWTVHDTTVVVNNPARDMGTYTAVIARTNGQAPITAVSGPAVDTAVVTVDQTVAAAAPVPTRGVLGFNDTVDLRLNPMDPGGTPVADAEVPVWSSGDPTIATVDASGLVTVVGVANSLIGVPITGQTENAPPFDARIEVYNGETVGATSQMSMGDHHACRIDVLGGRLWCRGRNDQGQLGDNSTVDRDVAVEPQNPLMSTGDTYIDVAGGGSHTCALMDTVGGVQPFCWGDNRFGQLGDLSTTDRLQPTPVRDGVREGTFSSITAGGGHTCGLTDLGETYCWGYDLFGQLGDGTAGDTVLSPVLVTGTQTFTQVAAGWLHTCALASDGTAWCWGRGAEGQLGQDSAMAFSATPVQVAGTQTFTQIEVGTAHTCGVTSNSEVWCWGYNSSGQTGTGSADFVVSVPTAVTFPTFITPVDLAMGRLFGCALARVGTIYCWGANDQLQLAQAAPRSTRTPIAIPLTFAPTSIEAGEGQACGIEVTRTLCWGGIPTDYLQAVTASDALEALAPR